MSKYHISCNAAFLKHHMHEKLFLKTNCFGKCLPTRLFLAISFFGSYTPITYFRMTLLVLRHFCVYSVLQTLYEYKIKASISIEIFQWFRPKFPSCGGVFKTINNKLLPLYSMIINLIRWNQILDKKTLAHHFHSYDPL